VTTATRQTPYGLGWHGLACDTTRVPRRLPNPYPATTAARVTPDAAEAVVYPVTWEAGDVELGATSTSLNICGQCRGVLRWRSRLDEMPVLPPGPSGRPTPTPLSPWPERPGMPAMHVEPMGQEVSRHLSPNPYKEEP
jgi:hypothetical protein